MGLYGNDLLNSINSSKYEDIVESAENTQEIIESCILALENFNNLVTTVEFCTENSSEFILEFSMDTVKTKIKEIWEKVKKFAKIIFGKIKSAITTLVNKVKKIFSGSKDTITKAKKVDEANKNKKSAKNESFDFSYFLEEELSDIGTKQDSHSKDDLGDLDKEDGHNLRGSFQYYEFKDNNRTLNCGEISSCSIGKNINQEIDKINNSHKDFLKINTDNITILKAKYVDFFTGDNSLINRAVLNIRVVSNNDKIIRKGREFAEYGEKLEQYENLMNKDINVLNDIIKKIEYVKLEPIGINTNIYNNEVLGMIAKVNSAAANTYSETIKFVQDILSKIMKYYSNLAKEQIAYKEKVESEFEKIVKKDEMNKRFEKLLIY